MDAKDFGVPVPMVVETTGKGERGYDLYSRLLRDRIIILGTPINDAVANVIVAQLLFLDNEDPKEEIKLYINSPGGSVTAGLAIYDAMQLVRAPVATFGMGVAASMGALLLAAGRKGRRWMLPNAEAMIHQPLGGVQGQATDIKIAADRIQAMKMRLTRILAEHTGQTVEKVAADTERDHYLTAEEAVAYGLIDAIAEKRQDVPE